MKYAFLALKLYTVYMATHYFPSPCAMKQKTLIFSSRSQMTFRSLMSVIPKGFTFTLK